MQHLVVISNPYLLIYAGAKSKTHVWHKHYKFNHEWFPFFVFFLSLKNQCTKFFSLHAKHSIIFRILEIKTF